MSCELANTLHIYTLHCVYLIQSPNTFWVLTKCQRQWQVLRTQKWNGGYCLQGTHSLMQGTATSTVIYNPGWQVLCLQQQLQILGAREKKKVTAQMWFKNEKCNKSFLRTKDHKESVSLWKISNSFCGNKYRGKFLTITSQENWE